MYLERGEDNVKNKQWKYKIRSGKMPVILTLIMFMVFGGLTAWLYGTDNGASIFTGLFSIILLALVITTGYRLVFLRCLLTKMDFIIRPIHLTDNTTNIAKSHTAEEFL